MRVFICLLGVLLLATAQGFASAQDRPRNKSLNNGRGDLEVPPKKVQKESSLADVVEETTPDQYQSSDHLAALELSLLYRSSNVRREIELTREQIDSLRQLQGELETDTQQLRHQLRKMDVEGRSDEADDDRNAKYSGDVSLLKDELALRHARFLKRAKEVLLPHQVKTLGQLTTQFRIRKTSAPNQSVLMNEILVNKLGISVEQLDELQRVSDQSEQKLKKLISAHEQAKLEAMLKVLTPEQRDHFEDIFGKKVDF